MSNCIACGKAFGCAMVDGKDSSPCWCTTLPTLPPALLDRAAAGCYCPDCLGRLVAAAQRDAGQS